MNAVAIVKVVWITTVFATSALVGESILESRTGTVIVFERGDRAPADAGTEPARRYAMDRGEVVVAWSALDAEL